MALKRIGFVAYDGMTALDLTGPMEAFHSANLCLGTDVYDFVVLAASGKTVTAESGLRIAPQASLARAPRLDTIVVPGGAGMREPKICAPISEWLLSRARSTRRMASVCTGIYAFGATGLLDGRSATTHWRFAADVAARFPAIQLEADAIFLRDGAFYTSAGVTAGIDLALALIEEDHGAELALSVARELVVYVKRAGGQMQFSEPLQFQTRSTDRFADLAAWIVRNLRKDLSVETLAARAGLGARHFSRRFKDVFGVPPANYIERLRLDEARRRLPSRRQTVESVAWSVGYASADAFRRAFERQFGIAPSAYRKRFVRS
ncbi:MAG: GlxA family transcriptional regulator [Rhodanobacteraceae bacterium]